MPVQLRCNENFGRLNLDGWLAPAIVPSTLISNPAGSEANEFPENECQDYGVVSTKAPAIVHTGAAESRLAMVGIFC